MAPGLRGKCEGGFQLADYLRAHAGFMIARVHGNGKDVERVKGIEPSSGAWEALALPLSYTRLPQ
jgi:hypothetical protein